MSAESLEHALESYGLELCQTHPALKGKKMRHADEKQAAESTGLVFEASRGNDRLDGPKGADVTLMVTYRSTGTPRQNELVVDAIDETFGDAWIADHAGQTQAERQFSFLMRMDDKESDRSETKSMRKRTRKIPFIAKAL